MADHLQARLDPESTVRDAVEVINRGKAKVALVQDREDRLLGTITDGDIRRGLLAGATLETIVTEVMNTRPLTIIDTADPMDGLGVLLAHNIRQLPVVDQANRVKALLTVDEFIRSNPIPNTVVIMAGGRGQRLMPMSATRPKPMIPVAGKPMLEIVLDRFIASGFGRFYISVNYLKEQIKDYVGDGSRWGVKIDYLEEEDPLGTAGALSLLPEVPREPIVVSNADVLTRIDMEALLRYHHEHDAAMTVAVRNYDVAVPYGVIVTEDHEVKDLQEKPTINYLISAGIYVLSPEVVQDIPTDSRIDMPDLMQRCIALDQRVVAYPIHEFWLDVGHPEALALADETWPSGDYD